jgi:hypothetical protein
MKVFLYSHYYTIFSVIPVETGIQSLKTLDSGSSPPEADKPGMTTIKQCELSQL